MLEYTKFFISLISYLRLIFKCTQRDLIRVNFQNYIVTSRQHKLLHYGQEKITVWPLISVCWLSHVSSMHLFQRTKTCIFVNSSCCAMRPGCLIHSRSVPVRKALCNNWKTSQSHNSQPPPHEPWVITGFAQAALVLAFATGFLCVSEPL